MDQRQAGMVLRADAVFDLLAGLLLLSGTWDGLWDALDLPQRQPAVFVQIGGAGLIALAYLLWRAAEEDALRAPVAGAVAVANALGAAVVASWLVSGKVDDYADTLGIAILVAVAVVLAIFALLEAGIARRRSG